MSASAFPIGMSSIGVPNPLSLFSSSSASKYAPVRMGSEDCIRRIKQIAKEISAKSPSKDIDGKFRCGVTLETMKEPTLISPCGHVFDRISTEGPVEAPVITCPNCRVPFQFRTPVLLIKNLIEKSEEEERIPTMAHFKRENKRLEKIYFQTGKECEEEQEYDEALIAYTQAFLHVNKSEAYAVLPKLYVKMDQKERAALAYLHLAMYQIEEGKIKEVIETLESAKQIAPNLLEIDVLLVSLALGVNPPQEQINEVLLLASTQKNPEDAIAIYKQVIAVSPRQLDVYAVLCPLIKEPLERNYLLLQAAGYAEQEGKAELALKFRNDAEIIIYPTSISKEDWINPAAFLAKLPKTQALQEFLLAPCPIYGNEGKMAAETHIVVARPKNILINDTLVSFTLTALNKLDTDSGGVGCIYVPDILKFENDLSSSLEIEFEWLVMTKDIFPESRNKSYEVQRNLVEAKGYQVPGFLDVVTCVLWEIRNSGTRFYTEGRYARCHEMIEGYHVIVGGFDLRGVYVFVDYLGENGESMGVAGLRKF